MKDSVKRLKQATNQEQIFAKGISDKGLLFKTYERILKLNNKETRTTTTKRKQHSL